jgi:predicted RNA-binding Zn ribbon-like protein
VAEHYAFQTTDLVGGHVVLDLVNTVTGRDSRPTDWLDTYDRMLEWATLTGTFDARALRALRRICAASEAAAALALGRLCELREAAYQVVVATLRHEPVPPAALAQLEKHWKRAAAAATVSYADDRAALSLDVESSGLDYPTHVLALSALELLQELPLERTRECASPRCTWIFIDQSRGGQRRWCDMATCGNQAKSRRHYERRRAAS